MRQCPSCDEQISDYVIKCPLCDAALEPKGRMNGSSIAGDIPVPVDDADVDAPQSEAPAQHPAAAPSPSYPAIPSASSNAYPASPPPEAAPPAAAEAYWVMRTEMPTPTATPSWPASPGEPTGVHGASSGLPTYVPTQTSPSKMVPLMAVVMLVIGGAAAIYGTFQNCLTIATAPGDVSGMGRVDVQSISASVKWIEDWKGKFLTLPGGVLLIVLALAWLFTEMDTATQMAKLRAGIAAGLLLALALGLVILDINAGLNRAIVQPLVLGGDTVQQAEDIVKKLRESGVLSIEYGLGYKLVAAGAVLGILGGTFTFFGGGSRSTSY